MPIFFQQEINGDTKLGIWKIEEEEAFFAAKVPLQRDIRHPHKRLQHLAGRYLLQYLFPDFPIELIRIADTRKPFLDDETYHFSISHCDHYAAAIVSKINRVGVDLELVTDKIERIQHKFSSVDERILLNDEWAIGNGRPPSAVEGLTLLWSCKEAVFKWYGLGEVDFKEHIQIKSLIPVEAGRTDSIALFKKNEDLFLDLHSRFFNHICLSYVLT